MRLLRPLFLALPLLALASPAYAEGLMMDTSSGALQMVEPVTAPVVVPTPAPPTPIWVDVAKVVTQYRIPDKLSDLRGVVTDASGKNYGFYYASTTQKTLTVYRNGRRVLSIPTQTANDFNKPVVFRMTASGDLLYAVHGTDLYVNQTLVSFEQYSFSAGVTTVHDEGGMLTFPEAGNVVTYDIKHGVRKTLYRQAGVIQYLRRAGIAIVYTVLEKGVSHIYKNGRLVSPVEVENPANFAVSSTGNVYFFTKAARGYSLYRDTRSYVTGQGDGAYVDIDPAGHVWHISYTSVDRQIVVHLKKDRMATDLLPSGVANAELNLAFPDGSYALRISLAADPSSFILAEEGETRETSFLFDAPHNDTNGFQLWNGQVVMRAYVHSLWETLVDGQPVTNSALPNVWFNRVQGGQLTVYATK